VGSKSDKGQRWSRSPIFWVVRGLLPIAYFLLAPLISWFAPRWFDSELILSIVLAILWPAIQLLEHSIVYERYIAWLFELVIE